MFKLRSPTSGTVLYAVGMNHTSERHIDGMVGGESRFTLDTPDRMLMVQVPGISVMMRAYYVLTSSLSKQVGRIWSMPSVEIERLPS